MSVVDLQELEEVKGLLLKGQQLGVLTFAEIATAVAISAKVRTPTCCPLRSRPLTSSSSWRSTTDIQVLFSATPWWAQLSDAYTAWIVALCRPGAKLGSTTVWRESRRYIF